MSNRRMSSMMELYDFPLALLLLTLSVGYIILVRFSYLISRPVEMVGYKSP